MAHIRLQTLIYVLTFFLAILPSCTAASIAHRADKPPPPSPPTEKKPPPKKDLRILPLGDSITFGQGSSDGNGYRLILHKLLSPSYNPTYIGREQNGTMKNNHHEGHKGFPIGPVGNTGQPNYEKRPNIVLLLAGTNDIVFNINVAGAPDALSNVIDEIVLACPDAVVLVGSIPPLLDEEREKKVDVFNGALPELIGGKARDGKKVALVNTGGVKVQEHIHAEDGIHPNDGGYAVIAKAWYEGIVEAGKKGWIQTPVEVEIKPGSGLGGGGVTDGLKDIGKVVVDEMGSIWFPVQVVMISTAAVSLYFGIRRARQVGLGLDWRSLLRCFGR